MKRYNLRTMISVLLLASVLVLIRRESLPSLVHLGWVSDFYPTYPGVRSSSQSIADNLIVGRIETDDSFPVVFDWYAKRLGLGTNYAAERSGGTSWFSPFRLTDATLSRDDEGGQVAVLARRNWESATSVTIRCEKSTDRTKILVYAVRR